jgi:hypothetical protein
MVTYVVLHVLNKVEKRNDIGQHATEFFAELYFNALLILLPLSLLRLRLGCSELDSRSYCINIHK